MAWGAMQHGTVEEPAAREPAAEKLGVWAVGGSPHGTVQQENTCTVQYNTAGRVPIWDLWPVLVWHASCGPHWYSLHSTQPLAT